MRASVEQLTSAQALRLISTPKYVTLSENEQDMFNRCLRNTTMAWVGSIEEGLVCIWGLCPPTILSDEAYLWLYTTPLLEGNEFLFVRHSQRAIQEMLSLFPTIVGHAQVNTKQSLRWLRWLGAEFSRSENNLIPFTIKARNG